MDLRYMNLGDMQKTTSTHLVSFGLSQYADISIPVLTVGRMKYNWILIGRYAETPLDTMINIDQIGDYMVIENVVPSYWRELVYICSDVLALVFAFKKYTFFQRVDEQLCIQFLMMESLKNIIPTTSVFNNNDLMIIHDGKQKKIGGLSIRPFCFNFPVNISVDYDAMNAIIRREWLFKTRDKDIADYRDAAIGLNEIIPEVDVWEFAYKYASELAKKLECNLISKGISEEELSKLFDIMNTNTLPVPKLENNFQIYTSTEVDNVLR